MVSLGTVVVALLVTYFHQVQNRPDPHHIEISDKLRDFFKTSKWSFVGSKASLKGPLSLVVKHEYKVPLLTEFPLQEMHKDCKGLHDHIPYLRDGVYEIYADGQKSKKVYCDMTTDGGGWTVFQRRKDGSVDFYKGWKEYKNGFGVADGEYWLGNKLSHKLTKGKNCELRIDMMNWRGTIGFAKYKDFRLENEANGYRLHIGTYTGTAGKDSLRYHDGQRFTTKDRDNDGNGGNCAVIQKGAWWYNSCDHCGLNGDYKITNSDQGLEWNWFPGGVYMKRTKMMFRCL